MNLFDQDKTLKELIDVHRRYAGRQSEPDFLREENEITDKLVRRALRVHRIRVHLRHVSLIWWYLVRSYFKYIHNPVRWRCMELFAKLRRIAEHEQVKQDLEKIMDKPPTEGGVE